MEYNQQFFDRLGAVLATIAASVLAVALLAVFAIYREAHVALGFAVASSGLLWAFQFLQWLTFEDFPEPDQNLRWTDRLLIVLFLTVLACDIASFLLAIMRV